ncbi:hypothetical protein [Shewanella sp. UCD-KL21]|uniref:hypothetical protein n=1 Tax=Shewanella sp. UCD-KL21 TaxID=1917164 RepID=UPI000970F89F|nr:hypothetical protein [Shewanella sp. UCD-KL21]
MTTSLFNSDSSYVVITRKHLSRIVLPYEVILNSLCYRINDSTVFNASTALSLVSGGNFADDLVLLEIAYTSVKRAYPLSGLVSVWFATQDAKELFIDRGYENYDVEHLNCEVVSAGQIGVSPEALSIDKPESSVSKFDLVKQDGILALAYEQILSEPNSITSMKAELLSVQTLDGLLDYLLDSKELSPLEHEVQRVFAQLCIENSLDSGWDTYSILSSLNEQLSTSVTSYHQYEVWSQKAHALVSGAGALDIPLNDNGSHVLRAIILVLLNPEQEGLLAIKSQLGENIGDGVFNIARSFVLLRSGYSLLDFHQRERLGVNRTFIQDLNAALYNEDFSAFSQTSDSEVIEESVVEEASYQQRDETVIEVIESKFALSSVDFVTETEEGLEGFNAYSINGLVPNAGFVAILLEEQKTSQLYYWLIDRRGGDGKYKGKLGIDLLQIQSNLPSDYRFEVDENGVFLRLSADIHGADKLKQALVQIKDYLSIVKAVNARKSSF